MTVQEFADCIGVHYNTVRRMIKNGSISAFKIGCSKKNSFYRIPKSEIQRLGLMSLNEVLDNLVAIKIKES